MNENQNDYVDINAHDNYPDSEQKIEVPTMKVIPLKKICMTIGQLPTAYIETMSYYEMLIWFIEYLKNNIIPTINNNAQAVQEVQSVVLSLQEYINNYKDSIDSDVEELEEYMNNYFENLDVQEEINNKLDDMLEDGVLEQIIEQFLQLTSLICFDNVADMKLSPNLANGSYAKTLGYYSKNDGGMATYKIRTITNNDVVDEGSIISLNDNTLVAELINNGICINVDQFGAKNDGTTDNRINIQNAVNYAIANKLNIHFDSGTYGISGIINFPLNQNGIIIKGNSRWRTIIQALDDNTQFDFKDFLRSKIEDIRFIGTGDEEIPLIKIEGTAHLSELNNCNFTTNMGLYCESSAYFSLNNCSFAKVVGKHCNYLISIKGEYFYSNNSYYEANNDTSSNNDIGVIINGGQDIYFTNSDICNWASGIGLLLNATNGTIKNVYIKNTTFVRNNINIDIYTNEAINNVNLEDNDFIITQVVNKVINVHRDSGKSGVLSNLNGIINLDGSPDTWDFTKELFSSTYGGIGGLLNVKSVTSKIPEYTIEIPINPIINVNKYLYISGSNSNHVKLVLSNKSPFKDYNLPEFTAVKTNGRAWTNYTISNTFHGELSITFNYDNTYESLFTRAYLRITYFD